MLCAKAKLECFGNCKQIVKGLGETLVGAYSGRALSFVAKKSDIKNPKVRFLAAGKRMMLFSKFHHI